MFLEIIWVSPSGRRLGVGTKLIDALKVESQRLGCTAIVGEIRFDGRHASIPFFKKQGFWVEGCKSNQRIRFSFDRQAFADKESETSSPSP